jgi:ATP-dependent Clp protease adaptor protein ClpS
MVHVRLQLWFACVLLVLVTGASAFIVSVPSSQGTSSTSTMRMNSVSSWIQMASAAPGGPAILDRPATIEKESIQKDEKVNEKENKNASPAWEIRLFNDPFNKREFVARCLAEVCGKSDTESFQIMMQAHKTGVGLVGRYMFEMAELYFASLQEQGLMVDMVQVDDE